MSDLTKWPRLLVVGEPVTREQANEILIRTNSWWMQTNDKAWLRQVCAEYGIKMDRHGDADYKSARAVFDELGVLKLGYLDNDRIMSSWVGGPKGWCDWDGRIGCSTWNIGKWPDGEDVTSDLTAIAEAWPFLTFHAQLISDEGEGQVVGTWAVRGGKAAMVEPAGRLTEPSEIDAAGMLLRLMSSRSGGERGVSVERLREALAQVRGR
jgi:hypothetical protein